MRRARWVLVTVGVLVALLQTGCRSCGSDDESTDPASDIAEVTPLAELTVPSDVPDAAPADIEDVAPDAAPDEIDVAPEIPADLGLCPNEPCTEGDVQCKYNEIAHRYCIQDDDGCWDWSEIEKCDDGTTCQVGIGCACEFGSCADGTVNSCTGPLETCQEWSCADGCCAVTEVLPPKCCEVADDCRDCINLETGETAVCPSDTPEGMVSNLCTLDFCIANVCEWTDKCPLVGECQGGECDPETGKCTVWILEECYPVPCWGATQEDAQAMCYDNNLCTMDECTIDGDFVAWQGGVPPSLDDCNPNADDWPECIPEGVYLCKNEDKLLLGTCDDYDPCTIDSCDPEVGCVHEKDFEALGPFCEQGADCYDASPCTVEYCSWDCGQCAYPPVDCDDNDVCTQDYCDLQLGCQHDPIDIPCCQGGGSCCLICDPIECDDGDPCTIDFGAFENFGDEVGTCKNVPLQCDSGACCEGGGICDPDTGKCVCEPVNCDDENPCTVDTCDDDLGCVFSPDEDLPCDDGDPQTTNACVDGECVVM